MSKSREQIEELIHRYEQHAEYWEGLNIPTVTHHAAIYRKRIKELKAQLLLMPYDKS